MQLQRWFILFLFTGLITTSCKTSHLAKKDRQNNQSDTTNTKTQFENDSNKVLVNDSIILTDTIALNINGDSNKIVPKKSPLESKVDYYAQDSIIFDATGKVMMLYDTAQIKYQDIELTANYIEIDLEKKELWGKGTPDSLGNLTGKPHFKQGESAFDAKEIGFNFETKKGLIKEAFTNQGEIYLHADVAKKRQQRCDLCKKRQIHYLYRPYSSPLLHTNQ